MGKTFISYTVVTGITLILTGCTTSSQQPGRTSEIMAPSFSQNQVKKVHLTITDSRKDKSFCDINFNDAIELTKASLKKKGYLVVPTAQTAGSEDAALVLNITDITAYQLGNRQEGIFSLADLSTTLEIEAVMEKSQRVLWKYKADKKTIKTMYIKKTVTPEMRALASRGYEMPPKTNTFRKVNIHFDLLKPALKNVLKDLFSTLPSALK